MRLSDHLMRCLVACVAGALLAGPLLAATPAEQLSKATDLFQAGEYEQAQRALLEVNRDDLSDEQKQQRDELLDEVGTALNQSQKATQDLQDAQKAFDARDRGAAERLYRAVADNTYATPAQKKRARDGLALIARQRDLERRLTQEPPAPAPVEGQPATQPATNGRTAAAPPATAPSDSFAGARAERNRTEAARLVQAGDDAMGRGQYDAAEQRYQEALRFSPGHPGALNGLELVRQHRTVEGRPGILEEAAQRSRVRWERTERLFQEAQNEVRALATEGRFDEARQRLSAARQLLEAGRPDASPPERYTLLSNSLDALGRFVDAQQRDAGEREQFVQRRAAVDRERERQMQVLKERDERISQLFEQAMLLRKQRQFEPAANVLREILAIDPSYERAQFLLEAMEDMSIIKRQKDGRQKYLNKMQQGLMEAEGARAPETVGGEGEIIVYPDEDAWRMISQRDPFGVGLSGESDADRVAREKLATVLPEVDFAEGTGFEEVVEYLRSVGKLSFDVNWNALQLVGIDKTTDTQGINLRDVKIETALRLLLDKVGGAVGAVVEYNVTDGVVLISTKDELDKKTMPRVYDVRDLLVEIRSFRAPTDIFSQAQSGGGGGGIGGGAGGLGGGGLGGGGGGGSGGLFQDTEDEDEGGSAEQSRQQRLTDLEDLIKSLIDPGTWEPESTIGSLQIWNDRLIVRHTASVHRQLGDLFKQLRESKDLQISIEARFITMQNNFLEEIGVDLDIILNQGNAGYDNLPSTSPNSPVLRDPVTGGALMQPRTFGDLGFGPAIAPVGGVPIAPATTLWQPYGNVGLVPQGNPGNWLSNHTTPIPILNNSLGLAAPRGTNVPGTLGGVSQSPAFQMFGSFLDNIQVDFLMRATQMDVRSSSVEAPRLVCFNGRGGNIVVGTFQNYVALPGFLPAGGSGVGGQAATGRDPTIGNAFTGRVLDVTPTVSGDRKYVTVEVRPQVQNTTFDVFPGATGPLQLPAIQATRIRTTVNVPDGGTILLGGLKLAGETEVEAGVPILSKIPVMKRAFTNRSRVKDEQIVLILIKPTIIIPEEQEHRIFQDMATTDMSMPVGP